jgi:hypothetical protein
MDNKNYVIDLDNIIIPHTPVIINNDYVSLIIDKNTNLQFEQTRVDQAQTRKFEIYDQIHRNEHIVTNVQILRNPNPRILRNPNTQIVRNPNTQIVRPEQQVRNEERELNDIFTNETSRDLYATYLDREPTVINLFDFSANNIDYTHDVCHEIRECYNVVLERCSPPCCIFSTLSCFIGCFNIMTILSGCNYICCLNMCKAIRVIAFYITLFTLSTLFIIYGIQKSIYYYNFNSKIWIIIEGASHIVFIIMLTLINYNMTGIDKSKYPITVEYIKKKITTVNYIKNLKIACLVCKITWTFLGSMFLVKNKTRDTIYNLIFFDIIIVNLLQIMGLAFILNLHNLFLNF